MGGGGVSPPPLCYYTRKTLEKQKNTGQICTAISSSRDILPGLYAIHSASCIIHERKPWLIHRLSFLQFAGSSQPVPQQGRLRRWRLVTGCAGRSGWPPRCRRHNSAVPSSNTASVLSCAGGHTSYGIKIRYSKMITSSLIGKGAVSSGL